MKLPRKNGPEDTTLVMVSSNLLKKLSNFSKEASLDRDANLLYNQLYFS